MDSTVHPRTGSDFELFQYGLESFLKEARTLVRFKHNNIVLILTYFEKNETAYLVMEYEVGQDLKSYYRIIYMCVNCREVIKISEEGHSEDKQLVHAN